MLAKIFSATLHGLDAKIIEIEADVSNGMPATTVVGLADAAIKESRERVRSCIRNSRQFSYPRNRISINLAPADIYKYGTHFDLGIALGILAASGQITACLDGKIFFGELSLDGRLRPVKGILPMLMAVKEAGFSNAFLPDGNKEEACFVSGLKIFPFTNIFQLISSIENGKPVPIIAAGAAQSGANRYPVDFAEVMGHAFAKRGLEIAAAGGHNVNLIGPPGVGKTMLAKAMFSILPRNTPEKLSEIIKIYSIAGLLGENLDIVPFRNPHHNITMRSLRILRTSDGFRWFIV